MSQLFFPREETEQSDLVTVSFNVENVIKVQIGVTCLMGLTG